jgi:glycosyltransferase involved in cell wall biosynthesis
VYKSSDTIPMSIKIAFTHPLYPAGGIETLTSDLAGFLSGRGYRVYMFVENLRRDQLRESDADNITFIETTFSGPRGDRAAARFIAGEVNRLGIDIVVAPMGWHVDLAILKQNTRAKIVFALHSLPLWEATEYFSTRRRAALNGGPGKFLEWFLVRWPHELITGRRRRMMIEKNREIYRNCDLYTVLCDEYKQQMLEVLGPGTATAENNHIETILNRIPPKEYGEPFKQHKALYAGRLSYGDKRVDRLLDIWARVHRDFPDWELCIVGDGGEKESLVRRCEKLHLTNVTFHGFTADPCRYYRDASIVCLTSTIEGWGLVISEGQQAGAVPVAFDVSAGVRRQIAPDGVNGMLVKPFDKREYARRLARLMGDAALREEMGRNAAAKAKEYGDVAGFEKWNDAFRKLLNTP